jgi:hypothetical protein
MSGSSIAPSPSNTRTPQKEDSSNIIIRPMTTTAAAAAAPSSSRPRLSLLPLLLLLLTVVSSTTHAFVRTPLRPTARTSKLASSSSSSSSSSSRRLHMTSDSPPPTTTTTAAAANAANAAKRALATATAVVLGGSGGLATSLAPVPAARAADISGLPSEVQEVLKAARNTQDPFLLRDAIKQLSEYPGLDEVAFDDPARRVRACVCVCVGLVGGWVVCKLARLRSLR